MTFDIFNKEEFGFLGKIYFKYHFVDTKLPLVVTFASFGGVKKEDALKGEDPWGYNFVKKLGVNVLSFSCLKNSNNYYRDDVFINSVHKVGRSLPDFVERIGYGASMGGYGISAYSDPLKVTRLLLINPISTRKQDIAVWDFDSKRMLKSFDLDWTSKYYDGADTNAKGYVVYDPLFDLDKKHAIRYKGLVKLKVPGLGHGMPQYLQNMGMLGWLVRSFVENTLEEADFYKKSRSRRNLKRYYMWMRSHENKYLTNKRKSVLDGYLRKILFDICLEKSGSSKYIGFRQLSPSEINDIRDLAIKLEFIDISISHRLMTLALRYRPSGKFICEKVAEYERILSLAADSEYKT